MEKSVREGLPVPPISMEDRSSGGFMDRAKLVAGTTMALAGVTLALLPAAAFGSAESSPKGEFTVPSIAQRVNESEVVETEAESTTEPLQVGVATYSWDTDTPDLFDQMGDIGMNGVRLSLTRNSSEADLATVIEEIPAAQENGVEVVVNLGQSKDMPLAGFPAWAADTAAQLPSISRFVILNEVNSPLFTQDSLTENVDVLYKATSLIHQARPDAEVSGLGLATQYNPIDYLERANTYAEKKYDGLHNIMDTLSIHTYLRPSESYKLIQAAEQIWDGPIHIDEAGWGVRNNGGIQQPDSLVSRSTQADYMQQYLKLLQPDPQVENLFNYRLMNSTDPSDLKTGIITDDGSKLPAYFVLKNLLPEYTSGG